WTWRAPPAAKASAAWQPAARWACSASGCWTERRTEAGTGSWGWELESGARDHNPHTGIHAPGSQSLPLAPRSQPPTPRHMPRADFYLIAKPRFREQPLRLVCELARKAHDANL